MKYIFEKITCPFSSLFVLAFSLVASQLTNTFGLSNMMHWHACTGMLILACLYWQGPRLTSKSKWVGEPD